MRSRTRFCSPAPSHGSVSEVSFYLLLMCIDPLLEPFARGLSAGLNSVQQPPAFDGRSVGRVADISGKDADWPLWSYLLEAHVAFISPTEDDMLTVSLNEAAELLLANMTDFLKTQAQHIVIV
jgi:hypothetical protein